MNFESSSLNWKDIPVSKDRNELERDFLNNREGVMPSNTRNWSLRNETAAFISNSAHTPYFDRIKK